MAVKESPLRELARQIEELASQHICWSQIHVHVYCLTDYMKARAYIEENRYREVEESNNKGDLCISQSMNQMP